MVAHDRGNEQRAMGGVPPRVKEQAARCQPVKRAVDAPETAGREKTAQAHRQEAKDKWDRLEHHGAEYPASKDWLGTAASSVFSSSCRARAGRSVAVGAGPLSMPVPDLAPRAVDDGLRPPRRGRSCLARWGWPHRRP